MKTYNDYIQEIEERKGQGLNPKPIDGAELLSEIILQIKDLANVNLYLQCGSRNYSCS
jgi:aconitate hydratase 2/2-methylisocitrate dehydratase